MLKENYNSPCEFAEQIIAYLYDEAGAGEKNKFTAHLKNCADCADEFTSFNSIRSSVLEWREADFDTLSAPHFDLSAITGVKPQTVVETEKSKSVFVDFWSKWIFNSAFAAAAVLLLFVGAGIFIYLRQASNEKDLALIPNESNGKIMTAPTAEKVREEPSENRIVESNIRREMPIDKSFKSTETSTVKENPAIENSDVSDQPVKVSTKLPKNKSINSQVAETENGTKQNAPNRRTKAPTLTNSDDDEDDSVRLSDLFAEIDTK